MSSSYTNGGSATEPIAPAAGGATAQLAEVGIDPFWPLLGAGVLVVMGAIVLLVLRMRRRD